MQHPTNYQTVLVSKTLFKRLVNYHAVCSGCGLCVNIHGGCLPCHGANAIIDMEIINAVATQTPEPNGRPAANPGSALIHHCEHGHAIGNNRTCTECETRIRLWE